MSFLLLHSLAAYAEDEDPPEDANLDLVLPETHAYVGLRASLGVPIGAAGYAAPMGPEVGLELGDRQDGHTHAVGLRFLVEPDPPAVLGTSTPDLALGPVVSYTLLQRVTPTVDLFPSIAAGFLFGSAPGPGGGQNVVLPILNGAVGARVRTRAEGAAAFVQPEIGLSDFVIPYMGLTVGMLGG